VTVSVPVCCAYHMCVSSMILVMKCVCTACGATCLKLGEVIYVSRAHIVMHVSGLSTAPSRQVRQEDLLLLSGHERSSRLLCSR
jgi:hypothetical protein